MIIWGRTIYNIIMWCLYHAYNALRSYTYPCHNNYFYLIPVCGRIKKFYLGMVLGWFTSSKLWSGNYGPTARKHKSWSKQALTQGLLLLKANWDIIIINTLSSICNMYMDSEKFWISTKCMYIAWYVKMIFSRDCGLHEYG